MSKRKYTVIFRTCDVVNAINKNPRPFDLTKAELIKVCFLSLIDAFANVDYKIIILGDKLSDNMLNFFNKFDVEFVLGSYGNDDSIRESLKIAYNVPDDNWIYFCEDDYLHLPNCFKSIEVLLNEKEEVFSNQATINNLVIKNPSRKVYNFLRKVKKYYNNNFRNFNFSSFLNLGKKDLVVFLPDYPDRYIAKYLKHSLIFQTSDNNWRQITDITFSFVLQSSTVKKHFDMLNRSAYKANDRLLSKKFFGTYGFSAPAICLSPMPGFSSHMHRDTMTKLINWEEITKQYLEIIKEKKY
ncbi:MAG: hypothetical protein NTW25_05135 [Candidatus Kapabacteria bacterium]|nr:hypothetical protein [Candidatus Kapabacteria bacterium]